MTKKAQTIKARELFKEIQGPDESPYIIDVRSEDEFNSGTIEGACCIPHTQLKTKLDSIPKNKKIILFCQSGGRSDKAHQVLCDFDNVHQLEGGIKSWQNENLPIIKLRNAIPIQRQVMITAGSLVTIGTLLAILANSKFYLIPLFVGLGLTFAGISGFCGLALVLEKMPWNKVHKK